MRAIAVFRIPLKQGSWLANYVRATLVIGKSLVFPQDRHQLTCESGLANYVEVMVVAYLLVKLTSKLAIANYCKPWKTIFSHRSLINPEG